ncbi:hypothetical protein acsn021_20800 [Anaerocolumna cellulosilytica]|uniref:Uncharacterized protein n=1 Tax=Anaerocolumna cellulosilytica TaxID=433286 RepID=A0A6S6R646_9FIRM|nr:DUF362 domain-containing protein [Anaerocolumna cellulosilytica]MBB5194276.1 uncharacterized protein (DUF362 family) [Anaerocolumna cellulosilytica]BCJ94511.1 hypothetical protein acsn021_20800 [Anaerocolumna cellulosilytica]
MRNRRIQESIVGIVKNPTKEEAIKRVLDLLPVKDIIKNGDRVVITPNWVNDKAPGTGTIVGPDTLRYLIRYVKDFNPKEIIIATGSGGVETTQVFHKYGYTKVIEEEKVTFIDLNYGPFCMLPLGHSIIGQTEINQVLMNLDVLISFTQLKQHEEATMSASIKNIALGWPPASIHGFPKKQLGIHEDLHGFIYAMAKKIPIDLAIVSADKAMIGTGPSDGKAVNTGGLILAGTDAVAVDAIGARLLGFLPQAVHYLYRLYQDGVGEADPKAMTIKGLPVIEAEKIFSKAAYGEEITLDKNNTLKDIHGNT